MKNEIFKIGTKVITISPIGDIRIGVISRFLNKTNIAFVKDEERLTESWINFILPYSDALYQTLIGLTKHEVIKICGEINLFFKEKYSKSN